MLLKPINIAKLLTANGARVNMYMPLDESCFPLWVASCNGHEEMVKFLLSKKACIDIMDTKIMLLTKVAKHGNCAIAKLLVKGPKRGIDYEKLNDPRSLDLGAALIEAVCHGHLDMVEILLDHGAPVNSRIIMATRH